VPEDNNILTLYNFMENEMKNELDMMPEVVDNKLAEIKKRLIEKAEKQYGDITFVAHRKNWDECFTFTNGEMMFWFNTKDDKSTHVLRVKDLPT
jgi:hypothetical protein